MEKRRHARHAGRAAFCVWRLSLSYTKKDNTIKSKKENVAEIKT
jgi:hypothetical protein